MYCTVLTGVFWSTNLSNGGMIPARITKSLHSGPSPVILPNAHTACSQTFKRSDDKRDINTGTAPIIINRYKRY